MNTNSQQLETIDIPLSKLLIWQGNVRTQTSEAGIKELAASIASVGLLQSIGFRKPRKENTPSLPEDAGSSPSPN